MAQMKAVQISRPGGEFELVNREIPEPNEGEVRIRVEACGICHSDVLVKEGLYPGLQYPRIPGHEVVGYIDKLGTGVTEWQVGDRVGVGWYGGRCGTCDSCRRGDFIHCEHGRVTGISFDGGYAEYMVAPREALALVPDELDPAEAAPLLCAGITTYNALRNGGAQPGDLVAIQGIGGLGHLAVQYADKFGYRTVAMSHGRDKEELARRLGARHFIDTSTQDPAEELRKLGGAKVILATAPNSRAISTLAEGLAVRGKLIIVAASAEPVEISPFVLIQRSLTIQGWASGHAKDSEETLQFSALSGAKPMVETYPLEQVAEAYGRMMQNQARFRSVLVMNS